MALGDKIKKLRKERDWTQDELAAKIGVHAQHLTRWEKNKVQPRLTTLTRIADAFGITVEELTEQNGGSHLEALIPDPDLLEQFQALAQLSERERDAIKIILDGLIAKHQVKNLVNR